MTGLRIIAVLLLLVALQPLSSAAASSGSTASEPVLDLWNPPDKWESASIGLDWQVRYAAEPATSCVIDGGEPFDCSSADVEAMSFTAGAHWLELTPRDDADGAVGEPVRAEFTVDVTSPTIRGPRAYLGRTGGGPVVLDPIFSDAESGIEQTVCHWRWPRRDMKPCDFPLTVPSPNRSGSQSYHLDIYARNHASLRAYDRFYVTWDGTRPYAWMTRLPRLMTHPFRGLRVRAIDPPSKQVRRSLRLRVRYQTITPTLRRSRWRYPARWDWSRRTSYRARSERFRFGRVRPGHYACLQAGAEDSVGHVRWRDHKCVVRAWDDRQLRRSAGWQRRTNRRAYRDTVLRTTRYGATLRLTRPTFGRAANILVRTCPRCGTIQLIGPNFPYRGYPRHDISLRSRKAGFRQIPIEWGNFKYRGNYRIKVVSHGRPVVIDGLAVSPGAIPGTESWRTRR